MIEPSAMPGDWLMAGDDVLANPADLKRIRPTIRFYCWYPSAVSLGVHQSPRAVDHARCGLMNWDISRRPTGGRALLHDGDLSYSVVLPGGNKSPHELRNLYEAVAQAWMTTLDKFGLSAKLIRGGHSQPTGITHLRDGLCLDSRVRGELVVNDRKITAAAQRIYANSMLQHGSVTLKGDVGAIADVLPLEESARSVSKEKLRLSATTIAIQTGREVPAGDLIEAAIQPFSDALNLKLIPEYWQDEELEEVQHRRKDHFIYSSSKSEAI